MKSGDGVEIGCYHVEAAGKRRGGLVVVQEIFGVNEHIRDVCDRYAGEGYEVLAPALFDRIEPGFESGYLPEDFDRARAIRANNPIKDTVMDCQMCIDRLGGAGGAAPVFIVGYCYGGTVTWVAACRCTGLAAASGYYGSGIKDFLAETPKCPTILHFGTLDRSTPPDVIAAIKKAHPQVPCHVYENADHGFNSDSRPQYNAEAAKLAHARTLALFKERGG